MDQKQKIGAIIFSVVVLNVAAWVFFYEKSPKTSLLSSLPIGIKTGMKAKNVDTSNWSVFRSDEGKFEVSYPPEWKQYRSYEGQQNLWLVSSVGEYETLKNKYKYVGLVNAADAEYKETKRRMAELQVMVKATKEGKAYGRGVMDRFVSEGRVDREEIVIDGKPVVKYTAVGREKNNVSITLYTDQRTVIIFEASIAHRDLLEAMVSTVKLW